MRVLRDIPRPRDRLSDYFGNKYDESTSAESAVADRELSCELNIANVTEPRLARARFLLFCSGGGGGGNQSDRRRSRAHDNRSNWTMIVFSFALFTAVRCRRNDYRRSTIEGFIVPFTRVLPERIRARARERCRRERERERGEIDRICRFCELLLRLIDIFERPPS